jgi:dUTP pyrophosphatase
MQPDLKFIKIRQVKSPSYGTLGSAGIDFFVPEDVSEQRIEPGEDILIPSGIKARVPDGFALISLEKSGIATKNRLAVGAKVVDSDYQGEIHIHVYNTKIKGSVEIFPGMKLVQFLLIPVASAKLIECLELEDVFPTESERGEGGFGSTNKDKEDMTDALEATR